VRDLDAPGAPGDLAGEARVGLALDRGGRVLVGHAQVTTWARATCSGRARPSAAMPSPPSRAVPSIEHIRVPSGPRIAHLATGGAGRSRIALMRAAVMRDRRLVVADLPVPEPGPGEVLVKTLACVICGSDLHALKHAEQFVAASRRAGSVFTMDLSRDVVMGHEFCAEIVEHGPATRKTLPVGHRVCSRPGLSAPTVPDRRLPNDTPGGYAVHAPDRGAPAPGPRRALDRARRAHRADGGGSTRSRRRASTRRRAAGDRLRPGRPGRDRGAPPGRRAAHRAADFSARRRAWPNVGADVVVDPARPPCAGWREVWRRRAGPRAPRGSWPAPAPRCLQCVGVPGVLDQIMAAA
jgi:hypothetical protein